MPNPPIPIEVKRRRGTLRKDRTPNLGNLPQVGALGDGWRLSPLEALERVMEEGAPWLAESDAPTVALLREALELHERALDAGSIRDVIACQDHVVRLLSALGFTPTARARLGLAEVKAASKLDKLKGKS